MARPGNSGAEASATCAKAAPRPPAEPAALPGADGVLAQIRALMDARHIPDVWRVLCRAMAQYGFDRLLYGANRFHRANGNFGNLSDWVVLTNHDPRYVELYFGEGMFAHAPMTRWTTAHVGACSWQWMFDRRARGETSAAENRVMEINAQMGVTAGYSISFAPMGRRGTAGIGLCARRGLSQAGVDRLWQRAGADIALICEIAHMRIAALPHDSLITPLTVRQREVLEWVADGKTVQDIATILGLTPATVDKHLRLARERLNAETTAQAVAKAAQQNQFHVFEKIDMAELGSETILRVARRMRGGEGPLPGSCAQAPRSCRTDRPSGGKWSGKPDFHARK